jgi:peroxidase
MNDSQSSVRRNESGVTSNAQLKQIINGQSQSLTVRHSLARFLARRATPSVAWHMMRHTARPTQSLAGFGPDDSEKLASFKAFRTFVVAMALVASGCSGGGGVGASITPNSGGVPLANAQSRTQSSTVSQSVAQNQQQGPIGLLKEFRPIGGSGSVVPGSPELAIAPLNFSGLRDALVAGPNPRTISNVIAGGTDSKGENGQTTDPVLSAWLYVFGQFLDHDLGLEETPLTNADISITVPPGDPVFAAKTVIAMNRDTRSPATNTIINTTAGYLDLSQLYGSDTTTAASLYNAADGTMKSSGNGQYLPVVNDTYVSGDPRVMENPELTALTTLFMREHNFWATTLKAQHPTWTGSQLYGMAKTITTAEYQNIVYTAYLPHLIGPVLRPLGNFGTNAQETQEFSVAAFRMGHSQVSDTQDGISNTGATTFTESLAQSFVNTPEIDIANGVDNILRSLGGDYSQATDPFVVAALRDLLFAGLVGGGVDQMDLIAIDIQRERDAGLGTLNQTRQAMHMEPYASFAQLTSDPTTQALYQTTYGSIDKVDLFMGGLAEAHAAGANVGPTFQAIIGDQFWRLKAGDRFFWTNEGFDPQTTQMIAGTTLTTLMKRDTATTASLQADLFVQGTYPAHHVHVPNPRSVNAHGRRPFLNDGI